MVEDVDDFVEVGVISGGNGLMDFDVEDSADVGIFEGVLAVKNFEVVNRELGGRCLGFGFHLSYFLNFYTSNKSNNKDTFIHIKFNHNNNLTFSAEKYFITILSSSIPSRSPPLYGSVPCRKWRNDDRRREMIF